MDKNKKKKKSQPEEFPSVEDIPLSLQGLEPSQSEDTLPIETNNKSKDAWVKEINSETIKTSAELNDFPDENASNEDIPDWLLELTSLDRDEPAVTDHLHSNQINEQAVENEELSNSEKSHVPKNGISASMNQIDEHQHDKESEFSDPASVDTHPVEGFINISNLNFDDSEIKDDATYDNDDDEEKNLPPWLKDMIAEPDDSYLPHEPKFVSHFDLLDEITEPLEITQETVASEPAPLEDDHQAEVTTQDRNLMLSDDLSGLETGTDESFSTKNYSPQEKYLSDHDEDGIEPVENTANDSLSEESKLPKLLQLAEKHMQNGENQQAVEIFETFIGQNLYLDEIKLWLNQIAETDHTNTIVWENIGDIALKQENPEKAFFAYAKAINLLLISKEEADEFD